MNELTPVIRATESLLKDDIAREVAAAMLAPTSDRIFNRGIASNGAPIGIYSPQYLKRRIKKGLGGSNKVIVTFTGQLQNDFSVVEEGGMIGLGTKNPKNAEKAEWVEANQGKDIFSATVNEEKQALKVFEKAISKRFNGL